MSWETSYKDSVSEQDHNPQRHPKCHCFAWRGDSTIAHGLLVLSDQVEDQISHGILGVMCLRLTGWNQDLDNREEYWKKLDPCVGICLWEANTSPAVELIFVCPLWGCQEPWCLADAGCSPPNHLQVHQKCTYTTNCLYGVLWLPGVVAMVHWDTLEAERMRSWVCFSHISQIYICLEYF